MQEVIDEMKSLRMVSVEGKRKQIYTTATAFQKEIIELFGINIGWHMYNWYGILGDSYSSQTYHALYLNVYHGSSSTYYIFSATVVPKDSPYISFAGTAY